MFQWNNTPYPKENYDNSITGSDLFNPNLMCNSVVFNREEKTFTLKIDVSFDVDDSVNFEDNRELSKEDLILQKNKIDEFVYQFKDKFNFNFTNQKTFCGDLRLANILSGGSITYSLGEGLFDFCYAEFDFSSLDKDLSLIAEKKNEYEDTVSALTPFINSSIYSLAFVPEFKSFTENAVAEYISYIKVLQNEFLALLDFCFNEDFYPELFKEMSTIERFGVYCKVFNRNSIWYSKEQFFTTLNNADYSKIKKLEIKEIHKEFSKLYDVDIRELETYLSIPHSAEISYSVSSLLEILQLEFSKMLEQNLKLRKCQYCNKYFAIKGNYAGVNCDRITEKNMTCQQLSANKKHTEKTKNSISWKVYNKYYKRYFARNKVGGISDEELKQWQAKATAMREDCIENKVSAEDFLTWAHNCFENRPFKKSIQEILREFE